MNTRDVKIGEWLGYVGVVWNDGRGFIKKLGIEGLMVRLVDYGLIK